MRLDSKQLQSVRRATPRAGERKGGGRGEGDTLTHLSPKRVGSGVAKKDTRTLWPGKGKTGDKEREKAKEIRSAESRYAEDNRDKRRRDMLSSLRCIHDSLIEEDSIKYRARFEEVVKPTAENVLENLGMMRGINMDAQELAILVTAAEEIAAQKALELYEVNKEHYERALRKLSTLGYETGQRRKIRETVSELESELDAEGRTEEATKLAIQSGGRRRTRAAVGIYMAYGSVTQKEAAEAAGCSKKTICSHAKKIETGSS